MKNYLVFAAFVLFASACINNTKPKEANYEIIYESSTLIDTIIPMSLLDTAFMDLPELLTYLDCSNKLIELSGSEPGNGLGVKRLAFKLKNNKLYAFYLGYSLEKQKFVVGDTIPIMDNTNSRAAGYYIHVTGSGPTTRIKELPSQANSDRVKMFAEPDKLCFVSFTMDEVKKITNSNRYISIEGGTKISIMNFAEDACGTLRLVRQPFDRIFPVAAPLETYATGTPCPPDWENI